MAGLWLHLAGALVGLCCAAAAAAGDTGVLHVSVADLEGAPVEGARIFIIGWDDQSSFVGLSDARGNEVFTHVPVGSFRIIVERKGSDSVSMSADVHADMQTTLQVKLAVQPRSLGVVSAHSSASAYIVRLAEDSPFRVLSGDLFSALDMVGGVNVINGADGPSRASIRGQDPSTATYQVDGLRLGGITAVQAYSADLLTSAEANLSRDQISLALAGPTSHAIYTGDELIGGFGAARGKWLVQDTAGAVGFVGAHVDRDAESALNGATYLDTSGLSYRHVGTLHVVDNYAKLVAPLGANTRATFSALFTQQVTHPLSTYYAGSLPSGIGPGQAITARTATVSAGASAVAGPWFVNFHLGASSSQSVDDESSRVLGGSPLPFMGQSRGGFTAMTASLYREVSEGRTLAFTASDEMQRQQYDDWTPSGATASTSVFRTTYFSANYSATAPGHALSSMASLQFARSGSNALAPGLQMQVSTEGNRGQTTRFQVDWGAQPSYGGAYVPLSDPGHAQYDCQGRTITAQAPGDASTALSQWSTELDWSRAWKRGQLNAAAYDTQEDGALLGQVLVPATSVPNQLPSWYIAALQAGYSAYGNCSGATLAPSSIFLLENVAGLRARYVGVNLSGSYYLARGLRIIAFYDVAKAAIVSADPRLAAPTSPTIVGAQLPGVPLHKLSLTGDWVLADRRTEILANVLSEPVGNEHHLPAYVLWTVGAQRKVSNNVALTLVCANVSHEYVGLFVSPRYAVPLPTVGGVPLSTVASPLPLPELSMIVHVSLGPGR